MRKLILFLLLGCLSLLGAETVKVGTASTGFEVLDNSPDHTALRVSVGSFDRTAVTVDGRKYFKLDLPGESETYTRGEPELPKITRSLIIGNDARMAAVVTHSEYMDLPMLVVPSKGAISRSIDPDKVPYTFGTPYSRDEFYPVTETALDSPYILRDLRGIAVNLYPFRYNPVSGILRVYTRLDVEITRIGVDTENTLPTLSNRISREYQEIYREHFLNYEPSRYTSVGEQGRILVICYDSFATAMQPYVNWKRQKGIRTDLVTLSTAGTTSTAIKTYIQNQYNLNDGLMFVLLVGDATQVPTSSSGGGGSDPTYSLLAGSDYYPDIFVGRFSAETTAQVTTQVNRSMTYERDLTSTATWLSKGTCINDYSTTTGDDSETDMTHMSNIRNDLLGYTYTAVDQIRDTSSSSATAAQVSTAVNDGRSVMCYVGHGADTYWVTTGFSNTNIASLTNDNKLPFIFDVACVNGNFTSQTCFAEAWMRATNTSTGNPIGAVGIYASTINQSWSSPMDAQDEMVDLLVGGTKKTFGGLTYNGSCHMLDNYGSTSSSDGTAMFLTWHIFGDPSLMVRTVAPTAMTVTHDASIFVGQTTFTVNTGVSGALACLSQNNTIVGSAYANASGVATITLSPAPTSAGSMTLTVTAYNRTTRVETIPVTVASGPCVSLSSSTVTAGGDAVVAYGESGTISVTLVNSGIDAAADVNMTVSTTDPYITLTDTAQSFGTIAAGATASQTAAFAFTVSPNVPNNHEVSIPAVITSGTYTWSTTLSFTAYAPVLAISNVVVSDGGNGRLDPGETVNLLVTVQNTGGVAAVTPTAVLSTTSTYITINDISEAMTSIPAGSTGTATFNVTVASATPTGHNAAFSVAMTSGGYSTSGAFTQTVGLTMEDFESGTLTAMSWATSGTAAWTVSTTSPYAGTYCAQSGTITHSQSTALSISGTVNTAGNISFYYKVGSESGYDFLKFYIDSTVMGSWSGTVSWTQATYAVTTGTHTFKWEYSKDTSDTVSPDCAYIDNIVFPAISFPLPPSLAVTPASVNTILVPGASSTETVNIRNAGDGTITYSASLGNYSRSISGSTFTVNAADYTAGQTTTWTFTAYNASTDSEWLKYIKVTMPTGVTVNSSTGFVGGSGGTMTSNNATGNGVQLIWTGVNSSGWGYLHGGETATATVNVTISSSMSGDLSLAYELDGDVYGSTPHTVTGTTVIPSGIHWITVSPSSGTVTTETDPITLSFNSNGIEAGIYHCDLTITSTAGNATVPVTLTIGASGTPAMSISPTTITVSQTADATSSQMLYIGNDGEEYSLLTYSVEVVYPTREVIPEAGRDLPLNEWERLYGHISRTRDAWLSVSPASGNCWDGEVDSLSVTFDTDGLNPGIHTASLVITNNAGDAFTIPVYLTVTSVPPATGVRSIAEFEKVEGVLVRYPFGIPVSMIANMSQRVKVTTIVASAAQQTTVTSTYSSNGVNLSNCNFLIASTDTYWTRDYGPWSVATADHHVGIVDFTYNRPRPNDDAINSALATFLGEPLSVMGLTHTGGNYMTDGMGVAASSQLVWEENSTLTHAQINAIMDTYLGIDSYHVLGDPNNTYINHIDCWGKFLDVDKVLIRSVPSSHAQYSAIEAVAAYFSTQTSSYGTPYQVVRVYTPNNEPYSNSVIVNNVVYVPQMGTANDAAAIATYQAAMPGYTIIGVTSSSPVWESTDAIHCRVMGLADRNMVYVRHVPLHGAVIPDGGYQIVAQIDAYSGAALATDSLKVWYRVNGSSWNSVAMTNQTADMFAATIPVQATGSSIEYFIRAADVSGHGNNHPFIGRADPHAFTAGSMPPSSATLVSPAVGTTNRSIFDNLNWGYSGSVTPTGYRLYLGTTSTPVLVTDTLSASTCTYFPGVLQPNTTYYWKVVPVAGTTTAFNCPEWSFTTEQATTQTTTVSGGEAYFSMPDMGGVAPEMSIVTGGTGTVSVEMGTLIPVNLPAPENACDLWMIIRSESMSLYPATIVLGLNGITFDGTLPALCWFNGSEWTDEGISDLQLLGTDPYCVQFAFAPDTRTVSIPIAFSRGDVSPAAFNGPTSLYVTGSAAGLTLHWEAVTGATSYTIQSATDAYGPFTNMVSGVTDTEYTLTPSGDRRFFRVLGVK